MKRILLSLVTALSILAGHGQQNKEISKIDSIKILEPVEVRAIRAGENAPFAKTNLSKNEIQKLNLGQDLPFILNQTPAVVVNSDAGDGVGYTGIRIRGSDATRINVTLNGIPYNDAESQGTFFVDLPDFISSVNSIQVQRGVGTSSNGSGAFGASINMSTNEINQDPYAEVNNSYGSFNTWKNTVKIGSGLVSGHFTTDVRLSNIISNGYIDRASSNLKSLHFSTAYLSNKSSLRFNMFLGKEKTYQAWYGVTEDDLKNNRRVNYAGTEKPGEPYDNETDNYWQNHYQLFFTHLFSKKLSFNTALFLTEGKGYYEQYKANQLYAEYNFPPPVIGVDTILSTDLVRRLWLDNNFYGNIFSLQYRDNISQFTLGGGWSRYDGNHFGDVIWAEKGLHNVHNRWYDLDAFKTDFNIYYKEQTRFAKNWSLFYDLQYRHVIYQINGFEKNPSLLIKNSYNFFNPKIGVVYNYNGLQTFLSYSRAGKEPNRDDFESGSSGQPRPERLNDFELGVQKKKINYDWGASLYYMQYKDQLVLTGKINDVGAYTRTNIPNSYRMGIELQGNILIASWLKAAANLALSRNKVKNFTEWIDDYDAGGQKLFNYSSTDIAFSPRVVGGATLSFLPLSDLEVSFISKYVSKQYLDNTQNENRKLNPFYTQDARIIYTVQKGMLKEANIILQANNIFNRKYEPNGYTFSYYYGGDLITQNYYFPMATRNFMVAINLKL